MRLAIRLLLMPPLKEGEMPMRGELGFPAELSDRHPASDQNEWGVIGSCAIVLLMSFYFVVSFTPFDQIAMLIAGSPW